MYFFLIVILFVLYLISLVPWSCSHITSFWHNVHFEYNRAKNQSRFSPLDPLTSNFFMWCYSLPWNCTKRGLVQTHSLISCISSNNRGNAFLLFSHESFIIKGCSDLWAWDPLLSHLCYQSCRSCQLKAALWYFSNWTCVFYLLFIVYSFRCTYVYHTLFPWQPVEIQLTFKWYLVYTIIL